jgi:hypothetical protein
VLAFIIVAAGVVGLVAYIQSSRESTKQPQITEQRQELPATDREKAPSSSQSAGQNEVASIPPERRPSVSTTEPRSTTEDLELTRTLSTESAAASLLAAKRVYVESLGSDPFSHQVRDLLKSRLQASGRFIVTENPEQADAAFKGSAKQEKLGGQVTLRLVNADGDALWPTTQKNVGKKYQGSAADVAAQVMKDLLDEIRRLERNRERAKQP